MADVCPDLPDELDLLDESIAAARRAVCQASLRPVRVRARLVANLKKTDWQAADVRKTLHESAPVKGDGHS